MKVYVDKLPKSCDECDLKLETHSDGVYRSYKCPFKDGKLAFGDNALVRKCPLQSLADYTKQVRREVCDEIRQKAVRSNFGYMGKTEKGYYDIYAGILEDIEQGESNVKD